ncbi:MAG: PilZ domain-containing protein [Syntrophobacteraceae bacterium]
MENRDYLRVRIPDLAADYNVLPAGGSRPLLIGFGKRTVPLRADNAAEDESPSNALLMTLHRIETKLDRVIGYVERGGGKPYRHRAEIFDISGGGVSLRAETLQPVDTLLDLCIFPRYGDPRAVFAIGRVCGVREEQDENGCPVEVMGVEFAEIAEEDRDAIVRFVFQAERKLKRHAAKPE